jgi:HEAT repeat protein
MAVRLLVELGRPAVPTLVAALASDDNVREIAQRALGEIAWAPPEAIAPVLDALADYDRWHSLLDRGKLFAPDRRLTCLFWFDSPLDAIEQALIHSDARVRRLAVELLACRRDLTTEQLLPKLCAASADEDAEVRTRAVRAVLEFAYRNESAWDRVLPVLTCGSPAARLGILDHLSWLRSADRAPVLAKLAADADPSVRQRASEALHEIELSTSDRVTALLARLSDGHKLDDDAIRCLRRMRGKARAAVPRLVELLGDTNLESPESRAALAYALATIAPQHDACPRLLEDADPEVRRLTLAGLFDAEDDSADLTPLVRERLADEEVAVRHLAAEFLWTVKKDGLSGAQALLADIPALPVYYCKERVLFNGAPLDWLRDQWPLPIKIVLEMAAAERSVADEIAVAWRQRPDSLNLARLYWETARQPDELVPRLAESILSSYFEDRIASLELLHLIGAAAREAVPSLIRLLRHDYWLYRWHALRVLGSIGPGAADALGAIVERLDRTAPEGDDSAGKDEIRAAAAEAVGRILPELGSAAAVLKRVADNSYVREFVAAPCESPELLKLKLRASVERLQPSADAVNG